MSGLKSIYGEMVTVVVFVWAIPLDPPADVPVWLVWRLLPPAAVVLFMLVSTSTPSLPPPAPKFRKIIEFKKRLTSTEYSELLSLQKTQNWKKKLKNLQFFKKIFLRRLTDRLKYACNTTINRSHDFWRKTVHWNYPEGKFWKISSWNLNHTGKAH